MLETKKTAICDGTLLLLHTHQNPGNTCGLLYWPMVWYIYRGFRCNGTSLGGLSIVVQSENGARCIVVKEFFIFQEESKN